MTRSRPFLVEAGFWVALTATGYFLLAALSLYATKGADNIAAIWPSSGYFLALLLLMPSRFYRPVFVAAAVASIAANMLGGASFLASAAFSFANGCEAAIALWLLRRREPGGLSFMAPRPVANFCLAALIASVVSAGIAVSLVGGSTDFFLSWLTTVALGMLIVTPPIVMLARMVHSSAMSNVPAAMMAEAILLLVLAALAATVTFAQSEFPLTFLPGVAVVVAAYRLGPFGAATGMLVVAVIASLFTAHGMGPVAAIEGQSKVRVFFLQFYLVTILFVVLPLAAQLVVRQRLTRRLEQSNRWLLQAEEAAHVGHWRVDLVRQTIQWSDQAYRIHGLPPGGTVTIESSLDNYIAEDRSRVRETLERAFAAGAPFEFQGRISLADGSIRHVKSHGSIEMSRGGVPVGIFGTIQDVTQTVENARMLENARFRAEEAANTDMLTGLPNRRHTLAFLDQALLAASHSGAPLAVAIFDIDHFKRINDEHGHAAGDKVIRCVGLRAKSSLREEDMVGRFGGEEFVCIFQGNSARSAELVAERVRRAIESHDDTTGGLPKVTVSIGLAVYSGEKNVEDLLHRADKALYAAKREGRNRLRMAA
ncbi:MAG: diguanylate cyclase [Sphingopyxis sp.]|uniref:sensor domain-containing diguanylate cyclase n=1 Tax=Sphingopyxis sp. TaxID=1908224 RepID=UPI002ABBC5A3|nr:diguanylate cyclase [Sphingopyxis sp.]MDZ3832582.1 diguanylate cyclase [Sphingopyxis sp.]